MRHRVVVTSAALLALLVPMGPAIASPSPATSAPADTRQCGLPAAGEPFETATPEEVGLDGTAVQDAVSFADGRLRTSVRVFRHNCLVGSGVLNPLSDLIPANIWSSTKSVVSLAAGIAVDQGALDLDAPIGTYLPQGWADAEHAALTTRQLMQQNSGLLDAIVGEVASIALDTDVVRAGLALPIEHEPGTYFEYGQRNPDIVAHIVERAVGEDLQAFVQRELFDPIGIEKSSYLWLRDRSGHTYGYANLFMTGPDFARIGLLLANDGKWEKDRVVSSAYLDEATRPSATNPCYAMLLWTNGTPCTSPDIPARRTLDRQMMPGFGDDAFATVGFLQQNNFVSPSRDTLVSWTGFAGDVSLDPQTLLSANTNSELYHEFFRRLVPAFGDGTVIPPYEHDVSLDVTPETVADIRITLGALGVGPFAPQDCLLLTCDGELPVTGLVQNGQAVLDLLVHAAGLDPTP